MLPLCVNFHCNLHLALSREELLQASCYNKDPNYPSALFLQGTDADVLAESARGMLDFDDFGATDFLLCSR